MFIKEKMRHSLLCTTDTICTVRQELSQAEKIRILGKKKNEQGARYKRFLRLVLVIHLHEHRQQKCERKLPISGSMDTKTVQLWLFQRGAAMRQCFMFFMNEKQANYNSPPPFFLLCKALFSRTYKQAASQ